LEPSGGTAAPRSGPGGEIRELLPPRGIELLDAVPRDHRFWDKTNNKATNFKAWIWFQQVLEANPGDTEDLIKESAGHIRWS